MTATSLWLINHCIDIILQHKFRYSHLNICFKVLKLVRFIINENILVVLETIFLLGNTVYVDVSSLKWIPSTIYKVFVFKMFYTFERIPVCWIAFGLSVNHGYFYDKKNIFYYNHKLILIRFILLEKCIS